MMLAIYILLYFSPLVTSQKSKIIIGLFIGDETLPFGIHRAGPAIDLGIEKLNEIVGDKFDVEVIRHISGSECVLDLTGIFATAAATMYHEGKVNAFIGPTCSAPVEFIGRMASRWKIPVFGTSTASEALDNKNIYNTLTRLSYRYSHLGNVYINLLERFNWTDVTTIFDAGKHLAHAVSYLNRIIANHINTQLLDAGLTSTLLDFSSDERQEYKDILLEANRTSRVFIIVCDSEALRNLMMMAHSMGMTNGDYVFLFFYAFHGFVTGDISWEKSDENDEIVKKAYESLLVVSLYKSRSKKFKEFEVHLKNESLKIYNYTYEDREDVNPHVMAFYNSFLLYGKALRETMEDGDDYRDSTQINKRIWNRTFDGINGQLHIDSKGDLDVYMTLLDLDPDTGDFIVVGIGAKTFFRFTNSNVIHWPNNRGPPANSPPCGFLGDAPECFNTEESVLVRVLSAMLSVFILFFCVTIFVVYRKMKRDSELFSNWWKIPWEDITMSSNVNTRFSSLCLSEAKYQNAYYFAYERQNPKIPLRVLKNRIEHVEGMIGYYTAFVQQHVLKGLSDDVSILDREEQHTAYYKGTKVSLSKSKRKQFTTNRRLFMELLQLRDVNCHNLAKFIGLAESESGVFIVTEFCSRGELRDILGNESFKLNMEFCISLICDIIQAMEYIHSSSIRFHGHLNSQNCVIDSRFVLKVTDYGIRSIRDFDIDDCLGECLWLAPEILRKFSSKREIWEMQSADIYSFGIIMYEILSRKEPFEDDKDFLTLEEIIEKLKDFEETPFRPRLDMVEIDKDIEMLMKRCWDEDPKARPNFSAIRKDSRRLHWNKSGDKLLDTLLSRMEEYADNLEGLVEERTQNLIEEKMRSDELLYQVLPRSVAIELKSGRVVDPEAFACVTIYFSDIVGFTQLSSESTPMQVVDLLNDLYTCFDRIIDNYDVYKVETIGDAYMVVSGLPQRNGDQHSIEIARMALSVLESVKVFKIRHRPDMPLRARIGIHSGPVCAGVVGRKMPRYCLFGDTVNTASRMESNGEAMKIHVSDSTRNLLYRNPEFSLEDRGELQIKGKGIMKTYWLIPPTSQSGII